MRRRLLIVAVFLLAGAVVNHLVASLFVLLFATASDALPQGFHKASDGMWVTIQVSHTPLTDRVDYFGLAGSRRIVSFPDDVLRAPPSWHRIGSLGTVDTGFELQVGWPLRSFWCAHIRRGFASVLRVHGVLMPFAEARVIPLRPLWPGFAINTVFYAVVLWLLIPGPFVLRRFVRVRRGLCPACAYPRGESDVCSECGKALPQRARVTT